MPEQPYFLGCPSWSESAWLGSLYPAGLASAGFLAHYCRVFNTVEGNTTLYAWPTAQTIERWARLMPARFRFCAKFPRSITHEGRLDSPESLAQVQAFITLLVPLGARVTPFWLQFPASFAPARLPELACLLRALSVPLAVEVRHPAFFDRGEDERQLNRLLRDLGVERICLDARALFSCRTADPAVRHAQAKKPRLPVRPAAFSASPQLRFIGHPQLAANDAFLEPWLDKVAGWIEAGRTPHVYLHTPDNQRAPELALRFHQQLQQRLPGLADLPVTALQADTQLSLLG